MTAHIAVLTATEGVDDATVAVARELFGVGLSRRLSDSAVEIPLVAPPPRITDWDEPVDITVLPLANRVKKLLIADMDSTMIAVECIDELADFAGVKAEVAAITEEAMAGKIGFEGALRARVALLEGLPVSTLEECFLERVRINPGAHQLLKAMGAMGAVTALVSGGFTFFTERVAKELGFQMHRANGLEISGDALTGRVTDPVLGASAKASTLADLLEEHGLNAADVVAVGDGANDIEMVKMAGLGVAYKPKPALAAVADTVLRHSALDAILAIQGIPEGGKIQVTDFKGA